ncbi:response regulator transcription factor [Paenibacillus sp. y28]|uniref:response regulator transcription factor n=1 Tax=Paenibacillus sp. y28 TaxID=3129110 RepID=UPI0030197619
MTYRIYLVEDEKSLNQVLATYLQQEGWQVRAFLDGESARQALSQQPDLWILDIMLPDIDGYQLIREIKAAAPEVPVIFISARDADLDRVVGLEMGSDDYLPKPFLPRELVIRARNLLERVYGKSMPAASPGTVLVPPYRIDSQRRIVEHDGQAIDLTSKEFELIAFFAAHTGQAFSREQLLQQIWGEDYFGSDRVVDDLIRRIRKKLPDLRLETMYGFGYRLVKP